MDWLNDLLDNYNRKQVEGEQRYQSELNREIREKREMTQKFDKCLKACVIPVVDRIKGQLESRYPCETSAPEIRDEKTGEQRKEKVLLGIIPDKNAPKYDEYQACIISFSPILETGAINVKKLVRKNYDPIAHDSNPIKLNGITQDSVEEEIRNFLEKVFA